jgi:HEPN domain-containing protein
MPPDEKNLKFISKWFQQAAEDLRLAKYGMEANPPFLKGSSFNAQQCAEKAIKGFLFFHGARAPKTHDLRDLSDMACEIQPGLEKLLERVGELTKYVTASRYPTDINFTEDLAREAIEIAEKIYKTLYGQTIGSVNK